MIDPYLTFSNAYDRLYEEYIKHKTIVVAVDFDHTLFDYHERGDQYPKVQELIRDCKMLGFKIVIFSGSAKERHPMIRDYCKELGISIDGINEDVIDWHHDETLDWSRSKIFYNIFLDDRAGLQTAYDLLYMLVDNIKHERNINSEYYAE